VEGVWVDRADRLPWHAGLLVDGELCSASGEDVVLVSPRDSRELARVGSASSDDVDLAVGSARAALEDGRWAQLDPRARGEVLVRSADLVAVHAPDLARKARCVWVNCFGRDKSCPAVDKYTELKSTWIELAS
jgi:delta 1-pyrroline-5-carboxylate dehydrogenase